MTAILVLETLLVHVNVVSPLTLTYSLYYVRKWQLWRIVTPFFYYGPLSVDVLLHVVFFFRYSRMLEEGYMHTSEYAYLLLFVSACTFVSANVFKRSLLSNILSSAITYIWTRRNRTTQVQLLGCIHFPAFYLPFVIPLFSILGERKLPFDELMGMLIGHVYFYLRYVVVKYGYDPLCTPVWLRRIFNEYDVSSRNRNNDRNRDNNRNSNDNIGNSNNSNIGNDSINDNDDIGNDSINDSNDITINGNGNTTNTNNDSSTTNNNDSTTTINTTINDSNDE